MIFCNFFALLDGREFGDQQLLQHFSFLLLHGVEVLLEFQLKPVEVEDGQTHQLRLRI